MEENIPGSGEADVPTDTIRLSERYSGEGLGTMVGLSSQSVLMQPRHSSESQIGSDGDGN